MTAQTAVAIGLALAAVRADPGAAARTAGTSAGLLAIGAQASLWLYLQATNHLPFRGPFQSTWWFTLAWHSYYLPLNLLWCAMAVGVGWMMRHVRGRPRLPLAVVGVAAQIPVLIWFAWPVMRVLVRATLSSPPFPPGVRVAFVVDLLVLFVGMPALTLLAALKGCATARSTETAD
jgi:hypothetical protein